MKCEDTQSKHKGRNFVRLPNLPILCIYIGTLPKKLFHKHQFGNYLSKSKNKLDSYKAKYKL